MKRYIIIITMTLVSMGNMSAQTTIGDLFKNMPDSILPYLSLNNRLDMLDFNASHMIARITNSFNETTTLDSLSIDYLKLTLSPASSFEMRLISKDESLIDSCSNIIKTTFTLGNQHTVKVEKNYSLQWTEIK